MLLILVSNFKCHVPSAQTTVILASQSQMNCIGSRYKLILRMGAENLSEM